MIFVFFVHLGSQPNIPVGCTTQNSSSYSTKRCVLCHNATYALLNVPEFMIYMHWFSSNYGKMLNFELNLNAAIFNIICDN